MTPELRYQPDPEQLALVSDFGASLVELLPIERLHRLSHEHSSTWSTLEELGLFGISLPEVEGGSGLGGVEESQIALALGRSLASPAVFATLASSPFQPNRGVTKTAATIQTDGGLVVIEEPGAECLLVQNGPNFMLRRNGNSAEKSLDDRYWAANLKPVMDPGEVVASIEGPAALRLRLIQAAALAGIAERALEMAVDYAKVREQFGRPIGTFQAVKHHCANMAIAAASAADLVTFAAVALDDQRSDAALQVEAAFVTAASAALDNAGKNIQIHGGIGFSDEADPHLFLKRAQLLIAIGGGLECAVERLADLPIQ